ncbi:MAG TPA: hypothetical protein VH025_07640 [Solirubrobacteraceae bacterium]|nr:hypothetical protein [Solirubrobacteraceae bacterium]
MYASARSLPQVLVPVLVALAIAGYLIGIRHASAAPVASAGEASRVAYGATVELRYPVGWGPASEFPQLRGLPVSHPLVLAPNGKASEAGLLTGQLPRSRANPLPPAFVKLLQSPPRTEVVALLDEQAYLYAGIQGYGRALDLYVVPSSDENPTALICYASAGYERYLHQCREIVAKLKLRGVSSYALTPEVGYARALGNLVASLGHQRVTLRKQMDDETPAPKVAHLAQELSDDFGAVAQSLITLEPPIAAASAQATLAAAVAQARDSYGQLSTVASSERGAGYEAALAGVDTAEQGVDEALENYALIGYSRT